MAIFDGDFLRRTLWSHRTCAGLTGIAEGLAMVCVPDDPEMLLRRDATAAALTLAGYPTSPKTLASLATRGGGPKFRKYGRYPIYRWGDALRMGADQALAAGELER